MNARLLVFCCLGGFAPTRYRGTTMNGPIVVGVDGTDPASRALTAGIDLAKMYDQPLHVVCGYHMERTRECGLMTERRVPMSTPPWVSEVLGAAESRARNAGVRVSIHGGFGRGSDAIIAVAEAVGAALIVIGDRGIRSKARFVLGNVPNDVVHHAPCSVHLVRTS
jgi:nucleotide-binding universal stress UspA family protein